MYSAELWLCCSRLSLWTDIYAGEFTFQFVRHAYKPWAEATNARVRIFMLFIEVHGQHMRRCTVYPKKYAHGFVVLCFVVVMQSFIMNSHEVFIHIHQGCFAGTGAIVRLPQCQWSEPDGYGKISQCITTTKHSKAKTVCIFLGIYCRLHIGQRPFVFPIDVWMSPYEMRLLIVMTNQNLISRQQAQSGGAA